MTDDTKQNIRQWAFAKQRSICHALTPTTAVQFQLGWQQGLMQVLHTVLANAPHHKRLHGLKVALYYPIRLEPKPFTEPALYLIRSQADPEPLTLPQLPNTTWALPVCGNEHLHFVSVHAHSTFTLGRFNIPIPTPPHHNIEPDVVVAPCVAFHRDGFRLGYGQGWYDKTLHKMRTKGQALPVFVGIAYAACELQENPAQANDFAMRYVVTENDVIEILNTQDNFG